MKDHTWQSEIIENPNDAYVTRIERFLCGKLLLESACGDRIAESRYFIAVIDGATPKGDRLWDGLRGDAYVARVMAEAIGEMMPDITAREAIDLINRRVRDEYRRIGLDFSTMPPQERLQASVVIYSKVRREVWCFGDCGCLINGCHYSNPILGDRLLADLRAYHIEAARLQGITPEDDGDYGRAQILPLIKLNMLFANADSPFGYDIINGGEIHAERVKIYPVQAGDRVVLASDGYPKLFDTWRETEDYLQWALKQDPDCIGLLRGTKGIAPGAVSFDDRSYIGFTVL